MAGLPRIIKTRFAVCGKVFTTNACFVYHNLLILQAFFAKYDNIKNKADMLMQPINHLVLSKRQYLAYFLHNKQKKLAFLKYALKLSDIF